MNKSPPRTHRFGQRSSLRRLPNRTAHFTAAVAASSVGRVALGAGRLAAEIAARLEDPSPNFHVGAQWSTQTAFAFQLNSGETFYLCVLLDWHPRKCAEVAAQVGHLADNGVMTLSSRDRLRYALAYVEVESAWRK